MEGPPSSLPLYLGLESPLSASAENPDQWLAQQPVAIPFREREAYLFSAGAPNPFLPGATAAQAPSSPTAVPLDDSGRTNALASHVASPNHFGQGSPTLESNLSTAPPPPVSPRIAPDNAEPLSTRELRSGTGSNGAPASSADTRADKPDRGASTGDRDAARGGEMDIEGQAQLEGASPSAAEPKESGISLRSGRKVVSVGETEQQGRAAFSIQQLPMVVKAVYAEKEQALRKLTISARGSLAGAPRDGLVMSDTKREWMRNINRNLTDTEAVKGQVTSIGCLRDPQGQEIRNIMVCVPEASQVPRAKPLLRVDVRKLRGLGHEVSSNDPPPRSQADSVGPPLARPSFSPFETGGFKNTARRKSMVPTWRTFTPQSLTPDRLSGLVALGTEEHPQVENDGALLSVVQVSRGAKTQLKVMSHALRLEDAVSAMDWLSGKEILVATGKSMIVVSLSQGTLRKRINMPAMHKDDIRDIQLSKHNNRMCLSGGYDGRAFVTDCERVVSDQMSYRLESSNTVYNTGLGSSVSSVQWNPVMANLASITTDSGYFHCFDTRLGCSERQTIIIKTNFSELYAHGWGDTHATLLGYGDGSLRLFDMRRPAHCVCTFSDPHVSKCGDIIFDPQRRFFVNFGAPGFSVWRNDVNCLSLWNSDPSNVSQAQLCSDSNYKQSGAFLLTGGRQHSIFGTSDAHGFFSLYDVHSAGEAAIDIRS